MNILKNCIVNNTPIEEKIKIEIILDLICLKNKRFKQTLIQFEDDEKFINEILPICEELKKIEEKQ